MREPETTNKNTGDTLINTSRMNFLKETILELNNLDGDIIEVGVYKGGSAKLIADNAKKETKIYLCDTFTGIPNKSEFDNHHIIGDFNDVVYDEIIELFKLHKNVVLLRGYFPRDTKDEIKDVKFKFVHLDVDSYISYKESLEVLYDSVVTGGYIIFDDYAAPTCVGATTAVNNFFKDKTETVRLKDQSYFIIKQ